jgi:tRNA nucleotidyltransferase/poly(A) polymerase
MIPKQLHDILKGLNSTEWMSALHTLGDVYIVGGAVRDAFLDKPIKDVDLVVDGTSLDKLMQLLTNFGKVSIVGQSFAVLKFKPEGETEDIDIAIPRVDKKIGVGHKDFNVQTEGIDIKGDLKRRDFTINSIAVNVENHEILDPFNGLQDLENKTLQATDIDAFIEDPLRIMRGVQFASRFRFNISQQTLDLMKQNAHLLSEIPGERIREEFDKLLMKSGDTAIAFDILVKTDLDKTLFGKKITNFNTEFNELDLLSFYYLLGLLGDQDPSKFYRDRLKGEANITKELEILDKLLGKFHEIEHDEEKLKWQVFVISSKFPRVLDAVILPESIEEIHKAMQAGWLPSSPKSIALTGDDVKTVLEITKDNDPRVGQVLQRMYKDALAGMYNWKDRMNCVVYLKFISD